MGIMTLEKVDCRIGKLQSKENGSMCIFWFMNYHSVSAADTKRMRLLEQPEFEVYVEWMIKLNSL